jgi:hypothetical protein
MLTDDLLGGDYDKNYDYFLAETAGAILDAVRVHITEARATILKQFDLS